MSDTLQRYNAMDCIATWQLWQKFRVLLAEQPAAAQTYAQTKAIASPSLYAMLHGTLVDPDAVEALRVKFVAEQKQLETNLDLITRSLRLGVINFASSHHVKWLIECLGGTLPRSRNWKTKSAQSVDRDALEHVARTDVEIAPIVNTILAWRDRAQMLSRLGPYLTDRDGRCRTMYKIVGTVSGRWSSGNHAWSDKRRKDTNGRPMTGGLNKQNVKRDEDESVGHASIRSIFVADPGYKLGAIDLQRADNWGVALDVYATTGDRKYLDACGQGDLHSYVSRLIWPNADPKAFFYRQFNHRFMAKKLQHGGNYLGTARTIAIQMKIPTFRAQDGLDKYFRRFPAIPKWHQFRARELQTTGTLTNVFGRQRRFHGRLDESRTLRAAIGWIGQSTTAEVINRALIRFWAVQLQMPDLGIQFLEQIHDEILFQYPEHLEAEVIPLVNQVCLIPIPLRGETFSIPLETKIGWNWAGVSASNPDGMLEINPLTIHDPRTRTKTPKTNPNPSRMAKRLSSLY